MSHNQQEQDTCRICSGPAEPDQPLFYPCKCSGTIRYIHQDCLKTWLEHSKKNTCDVCKHPYAFTKIYAADMPEKVPVTVLVYKFVEQVVSAVFFILRAVLVTFVWLTVLPYATLLTWRLYFRFGNILAWLISSHPIRRAARPPVPLPPRGNLTAISEHFTETVVKPYIRSLPGDIFTGQIIASLIVLAFLAVFLLREWIQQNARPGVFDEPPAQPEGAPVPQAQPPQEAQVQPQPQPQAQPPPPPLPQIQVQVPAPVQEVRPQPPQPQPERAQQAQQRQIQIPLQPRLLAHQPIPRLQAGPPPAQPQGPLLPPPPPQLQIPPGPRRRFEPVRPERLQPRLVPGERPLLLPSPQPQLQLPPPPPPSIAPAQHPNLIVNNPTGGRAAQLPPRSSSSLRVVNADPSTSSQSAERRKPALSGGGDTGDASTDTEGLPPSLQKNRWRDEHSEYMRKRMANPTFTLRRNVADLVDIGEGYVSGSGRFHKQGLPAPQQANPAAAAARASSSSSSSPQLPRTATAPGVPAAPLNQDAIKGKSKAQDYDSPTGDLTGRAQPDRQTIPFTRPVAAARLASPPPPPPVLKKEKFDASFVLDGRNALGINLDNSESATKETESKGKAKSELDEIDAPSMPMPSHPLTPGGDFQFTFQSPRIFTASKPVKPLPPSSSPSSSSSSSNGTWIFTYPKTSNSNMVNGKPSESSATVSSQSQSADSSLATPTATSFQSSPSGASVAAVAAAAASTETSGKSTLGLSGTNESEKEEKRVDPKYTVTPQSSAASNYTSSEDEPEKNDESNIIPPSNQDVADVTSAPRRPPLAASMPLPPSIPLPDQANAEASTSAMGGLPLPSPSLATYKAPEELVLDDKGYFESRPSNQIEEKDENEADDDDDDDDEGRLTDYFIEPKAPVQGEAPAVRDSDDEDDEVEVRQPERRQERQANEGQENRPAAAAGAEPANQDADDEDREQNLDDDLDGAMEAVGLRGPALAVFQNASLMFVILNITIGAGIWLPFTIGKTTALLSLEPRRTLQILHLPIRAVRFITDPTVDAIIFIMRGLTFALVSYFARAAKEDPIAIMLGGWFASLAKLISINRIMSFLKMASTPTAPAPEPIETVSSMWSSMAHKFLSFTGISSQPLQPALEVVSPQTFADSPVFQYLEDAFAGVGRSARAAAMAVLKEWTSLAEHDGNAERVWAVLLGYAVVVFLAALYLNAFTVGHMRTAERAVRSAIRQQMIVTKVALFIVIELVMFPFGCGLVLDYCTLPLFAEASVECRLDFFVRAPVTACFYHWLLGTMFMYQFAILLATCRDVLRPGCMWFIKDPQDPSFHPIRDILDRSTVAQLRKLGLSAIMYGIVIFMGVGMVISGLSVLLPFVFPLRWKLREPLSEIPVDLLFAHLVLPLTLHYFRPKKLARNLMAMWWKWSARQLRLTSYMFGDRHEDEEYTCKPAWLQRLTKNNEPAPTTPARDGGFCRVPAGDNIAFLRDRPAMIRVDEKGEALTPRGRETIQAQDAEARRTGRNPAEDYKVVYIPPHFIKRILLFISLFWVSGALALFTGITIPIVAGRAIFRLFTTREFHDGYSFIIGFYVVWWSWLVGSLFVKVRIRRQRHAGVRDDSEHGGGRVRASWLLFLFKRITVYFSKIIWLVFWLGFVIPTLLSIVVDLYLIIPIRTFFNPGFTPTIHIFESWASGLILAKIIIKAHARLGADFNGADLNGALDAIRRNGWRRPEPWEATKGFIIPVVVGLVGMIGFPLFCVYVSSKVFVLALEIEDANRLVYPTIFVIMFSFRFAMRLTGIFTKWTQNIRDKEFLVELRLRNLEHPPRNVEEKPKTSGTAAA